MTPRHTLMALLVVVIWGLNFLAIDFGLEGVPPLLFLAMRFTLVVIPAIFFLKPPDIGWRNILLIGTFISLAQFALLYLALSLVMPPWLASFGSSTNMLFGTPVCMRLRCGWSRAAGNVTAGSGTAAAATSAFRRYP